MIRLLTLKVLLAPLASLSNALRESGLRHIVTKVPMAFKMLKWSMVRAMVAMNVGFLHFYDLIIIVS